MASSKLNFVLAGSCAAFTWLAYDQNRKNKELFCPLVTELESLANKINEQADRWEKVLLEIQRQDVEIQKILKNKNASNAKNDPPAFAVPAPYEPLQYDFRQVSGDGITRFTIQNLNDLIPRDALLRLVFHEGCDASVLLDPEDDAASKKESPPNS